MSKTTSKKVVESSFKDKAHTITLSLVGIIFLYPAVNFLGQYLAVQLMQLLGVA